MTLANYITIISAVILTILILLQTRGASLGAGLGGGGEVNTVRRGSEKSLHNITIFFVVVFAVSLLANIVQL
ncbi:MAG: preprotein translocase subunit SecG [Candidatus Saccharimonadales bacterium]